LKKIGKKAAQQTTETLKIDVKFVEFDGKRYHFSVKRYRRHRIENLDGSVEDSFIHDDPMKSQSLPFWYEVAAYPIQLENSDLLFMVKNQLTQEEHIRFE